MNKYALHVAGGALLATTALVSGTVAVHAQATIRGPATFGQTLASLTAVPLATQMISATTGSAATIGPQAVTIDPTAKLFEVTTVLLDVTGAQFATSAAIPTVSIYDQSTTGTLETAGGTGTGANATVTVFSQRVRITGVSAVTWSAMVVSGLTYREAQGLATAGSSITLSGNVLNGAETATLEAITARAAVTSVSAVNAEVVAGNTITISNTSTPQFAAVTQTGTGVATVGGTNVNSAVLSRVTLTATLAVSTNLTTTITASNAVSTTEIKLTHNVLTDPAVVSATFATATTGAGIIATRTPTQFSSGSVTFSPVAAASISSGANGFVLVQFNGSTPIANWAAGTTTTTHTAAAPTAVAVTGGSGTATALNRGGLNAQLNFIQPSTNAFQSFIRISNTGAQPGAVTITVRSSSTGATLGTYTSPAISAGGTIQISAANIETQSVPAITPVLGQPYDVLVNGPITGYVQHMGFNAASGVITDLSSFRNGGAAAP